MSDIFIYVGIAVVAYWVGWTVRGVVLIYKLSRNPQMTLDLLEQLKELNEADNPDQPQATGKPANWVEVQAEYVGQMVYAYSKQDNQFLGQGTSIEEAVQMAKSRFPAKVFWWNESKKDSQTA
jgi:hypothetical protein